MEVETYIYPDYSHSLLQNVTSLFQNILRLEDIVVLKSCTLVNVLENCAFLFREIRRSDNAF